MFTVYLFYKQNSSLFPQSLARREKLRQQLSTQFRPVPSFPLLRRRGSYYTTLRIFLFLGLLLCALQCTPLAALHKLDAYGEYTISLKCAYIREPLRFSKDENLVLMKDYITVCCEHPAILLLTAKDSLISRVCTDQQHTYKQISRYTISVQMLETYKYPKMLHCGLNELHIRCKVFQS